MQNYRNASVLEYRRRYDDPRSPFCLHHFRVYFSIIPSDVRSDSTEVLRRFNFFS